MSLFSVASINSTLPILITTSLSPKDRCALATTCKALQQIVIQTVQDHAQKSLNLFG